MNTLSEFIKTNREEKHYTLRKLAELSGLSHSYISKLESGIDPRSKKTVMPTLYAVYKIAIALEVPLEDIIQAAGYPLSIENNRSEYVRVPIEWQINKIISDLEDESKLIELDFKSIDSTSRILLVEMLKSILEVARKVNK